MGESFDIDRLADHAYCVDWLARDATPGSAMSLHVALAFDGLAPNSQYRPLEMASRVLVNDPDRARKLANAVSTKIFNYYLHGRRDDESGSKNGRRQGAELSKMLNRKARFKIEIAQNLIRPVLWAMAERAGETPSGLDIHDLADKISKMAAPKFRELALCLSGFSMPTQPNVIDAVDKLSRQELITLVAYLGLGDPPSASHVAMPRCMADVVEAVAPARMIQTAYNAKEDIRLAEKDSADTIEQNAVAIRKKASQFEFKIRISKPSLRLKWMVPLLIGAVLLVGVIEHVAVGFDNIYEVMRTLGPRETVKYSVSWNSASNERVRFRLAWILYRNGELNEAERVARNLFKSDDPVMQGDAHYLLGSIRMTQGFYEESIGLYKGSERLYSGNPLKTARAIIERNRTSILAGKAQDVDLTGISGDLDPWTKANMLNVVVMAEIENGHYEIALERAHEREKIFESDGNTEGVADVSADLGMINALLGNIPLARHYTIKAQNLSHSLGLDEYFLNCQVNWVAIEHCLGGNPQFDFLEKSAATYPSIHWTLKIAGRACSPDP